jgi:RNA-directed DNA polymerase
MQVASRTLDLMKATQQKQLELNLGKVESRRDRSSEAFIAERLAESPTGEVRLMESICERQNMNRALKRVRENKGAPGIDGMTVDELPGYLIRHWPKIKAQLLTGDYQPIPVRRAELRKPDGGVRLLGIPSVLDRLIQQATAQVFEVLWDRTFSESSHGFRPGRSQRGAIEQARGYIKEGHGWAVHLDLEKFFDTSSHYTPFNEVASKSGMGSHNTLIRSPLRLPRLTCMASSSPRFTRCNTVWRDTPRRRIASTIGT